MISVALLLDPDLRLAPSVCPYVCILFVCFCLLVVSSSLSQRVSFFRYLSLYLLLYVYLPNIPSLYLTLLLLASLPACLSSRPPARLYVCCFLIGYSILASSGFWQVETTPLRLDGISEESRPSQNPKMASPPNVSESRRGGGSQHRVHAEHQNTRGVDEVAGGNAYQGITHTIHL